MRKGSRHREMKRDWRNSEEWAQRIILVAACLIDVKRAEK